MGRASPLLTRRGAAFGALLAALLAYYIWREWLPNVPTNADVAILAVALIPAVFGLVYLALPLSPAHGVLPVALAFALLAVLCHRAGLDIAANFAKLAAATGIAFWFLRYFESATWITIVALIVPAIDAYSVWRGPTKHIVVERPEVFSALSFAFPVPGERRILVEWLRPNGGNPDGYNLYRATTARVPLDEPVNSELIRDRDFYDGERDARASYWYVVEAVYGDGRAAAPPVLVPPAGEGSARAAVAETPRAPHVVTAESGAATAKLGLPDLLFFSLFLAGAARFGLRVRWTWLLMTLSFGATIVLAVWGDVLGLPALPLLALGFLAPNADRLWRAARRRGQ